MDIMSIANSRTSTAQTGERDAVSMTMVKKSQDIASSTAAQLLEGITPIPRASTQPSHLGNTINTTA